MKPIPKFHVLKEYRIPFDGHKSHLLPCWGTIKKSPSALQKAQLSIDLLAVYLQMMTYNQRLNKASTVHARDAPSLMINSLDLNEYCILFEQFY